MSASLHLDLLTDEERVSPNPIRLRVMLPLCGGLAVLGTAVWWILIAFRVHAATLQKSALEADLQQLKPSHAEVLRLRAQEQENAATLRQLTFYRNSRLRFGETFARLAEHVPASLQLTELRVPPPPPLPPPLDPLKPPLGPTNLFETVTLRLLGRAGGDSPSIDVNALLKSIGTPPFTNLIRSAEIPKGAFRQDTARATASRDTLLFEITCDCFPRRFE
ncbi:MAG TPA: hypothetical protein PKM57_15915 [Kiritimatiellia bacterium]|nr:hypothetical protein [Kiritimatiellia bacterium]HPS07398.1 hypothetical protein [Kiritimatiellia bacterium]